MFPVALTLLNVPTDVMFGCAAVVTVPAVVAVATVPVTLAPGMLVNPAPEPLNAVASTLPLALRVVAEITLAPVILPPMPPPVVILPVTLKLVNSPTLVILGCAAVVTVPAVVALVAVVAEPALTA